MKKHSIYCVILLLVFTLVACSDEQNDDSRDITEDKNGYHEIELDKGLYKGQFSDNEANGYGEMFFDNGDVFKGQWKDSEKHGSGIFYLADGSVVEGNWIEDVFVNVSSDDAAVSEPDNEAVQVIEPEQVTEIDDNPQNETEPEVEVPPEQESEQQTVVTDNTTDTTETTSEAAGIRIVYTEPLDGYYRLDFADYYYVGTFKDSKAEGEGYLEYTDRSNYTGTFSDGYMEGYGVFYGPNGSR